MDLLYKVHKVKKKIQKFDVLIFIEIHLRI